MKTHRVPPNDKLWQKAAKDKVVLKDIKDVELAFNTADSEHLELDKLNLTRQKK